MAIAGNTEIYSTLLKFDEQEVQNLKHGRAPRRFANDHSFATVEQNGKSKWKGGNTSKKFSGMRCKACGRFSSVNSENNAIPYNKIL